jgi:hypothetical protein
MLAEILSAAEFLDGHCMRVVEQQLEGASNPLTPTSAAAAVPSEQGSASNGSTRDGSPCSDPGSSSGMFTTRQSKSPPFYMVIETHGSREAHDMDKLDTFLEVTIMIGKSSHSRNCRNDLVCLLFWLMSSECFVSLST